jgi:hypothetical protein
MGLQSGNMGFPNIEGEFRQFQQALIDGYVNLALLAAPAGAGRVVELACTPAGRGVAASLLQLLGQAERGAGMSLPPGLNSTAPTSASAIINAVRQSTSAANQTRSPAIVRPTWPSGGG